LNSKIEENKEEFDRFAEVERKKKEFFSQIKGGGGGMDMKAAMGGMTPAKGGLGSSKTSSKYKKLGKKEAAKPSKIKGKDHDNSPLAIPEDRREGSKDSRMSARSR